ncbi:hypothetical protein OROMI_003067 [Orobanche minor]
MAYRLEEEVTYKQGLDEDADVQGIYMNLPESSKQGTTPRVLVHDTFVRRIEFVAFQAEMRN